MRPGWVRNTQGEYDGKGKDRRLRIYDIDLEKVITWPLLQDKNRGSIFKGFLASPQGYITSAPMTNHTINTQGTSLSYM